MPSDFDRRLERMLTAMFSSDDPLMPLRRDAARQGAGTIGVELPGEALDPALRPIVDKISREPFKVIDEDVQALRDAGLSTAEIFDLAVGAAVGATLGRLRIARQLISEESP